MTIEDKAKAYDEALKRAEGVIEQNPLMEYLKKGIEYIFPELAESEDEKIKEALIQLVKCNERSGYFVLNNVSTGSMIAWLEKQGEHHIACSEEQMKVLDEVLNFAANHESPYWNNYIFETLNGLIKQLKKLKVFAGNNDTLDDKDEEIRKALINVFTTHKDYEVFFGVSVEDIRAWLEKQGEQEKPQVYKTDDGEVITYSESEGYKVIEPKFKVGDWVMSTLPGIKYPHLITDIQNGYYIFGEDDDYAHIASNDNILKLWTIQDAKDGNVLVYRNTVTEIIMLFKSWVVDREAAYTHFHIFDNDFRVNDSCDCGNGAHPATKEQRDLLFQKMKEAGYEWDAEKKELKKISQRMISAEAKEAMYSKPTDLEEFINELSKQFPDVSFAKLSRIAVRVAKWAKPSDEEMKELLRTEYEKGRADTIAEMQKPTWSEEDNKWIESLIQTFENGYLEGFNQLKSYGVISWFKSLKERL